MTHSHSKQQKIFSILTGMVFIALLIPVSVNAQHHVFSGHGDIDADITHRLHHDDAEYAMTTREGSVDLLVANDAILIQFSDRFLENLEEEIRDDEEENYDEASVLADVIKSMVSSGVREMLDHALAIALDEIGEVYYDDGRLYIIDREGEEIFGDLEIDDVDVMEDFSRRDSRRFVAEAEKRMI